MNNLNKKIAVIGKEDVISCFKFVGFETFYANNSKQINEIISKLKTNIDEYAIIYITENFFEDIFKETEKINKISLVSFVFIPDNTGSKNKALKVLSSATEQAVGSDILK